jgi:hypothetical protein
MSLSRLGHRSLDTLMADTDRYDTPERRRQKAARKLLETDLDIWRDLIQACLTRVIQAEVQTHFYVLLAWGKEWKSEALLETIRGKRYRLPLQRLGKLCTQGAEWKMGRSDKEINYNKGKSNVSLRRGPEYNVEILKFSVSISPRFTLLDAESVPLSSPYSRHGRSECSAARPHNCPLCHYKPRSLRLLRRTSVLVKLTSLHFHFCSCLSLFPRLSCSLRLCLFPLQISSCRAQVNAASTPHNHGILTGPGAAAEALGAS